MRIGHKRAECGFQRIHADCHHHHAGNGDRRAGAGKRLEQAAEAEGDDDRLYTQVGADHPETAPQDVEYPDFTIMLWIQMALMMIRMIGRILNAAP